MFCDYNIIVHVVLVPTGLLGLQGDDPSGQLIRNTMKSLQVSDRYVQGILDTNLY